MADYIDLPIQGGGSPDLAGLTDVDINLPADGEHLVYDSATSKWKNSVSGGGGVIDGEVDTFNDLPTAVGKLNQIWFVRQSTGVWLVNRKSLGFYMSDNSQWIIAPEIEGYVPNAAKGNLTEDTSSVLTITGGTSSTIGNVSILVKKATALVSGYLEVADG